MIRSRASKSYWVIMVTMLLVHHTMAGVSVMTKRQAELEEDPLFHVTSYLDDLEANLLETLDYLIENQEAQDRVLLEDVQNLIFAVQSIDVDPSLTPVALAAIATNPTSVFLIGSIVASTVIASQVSSYALVGQTLTFNSRQGGLIRMFLDLISSVMRGFNSVAQDKIEIDELGSGSGDDGSGSGNEDFFDYEQGSTAGVNEEEEGGLLYSISTLIRQVLGQNEEDDSEYVDEDYGSGEDSSEEEDNSISMDVEDGTILDLVFNIIPNTMEAITGGNEVEEYEYIYDEDNKVGINVTDTDTSDGGSSVGGVTISLHTVDLAKLFVDVQKSILENTAGVNCTCGESLLTEENITNATIKLVEEEKKLQSRKRKRQLEKKKRNCRVGRGKDNWR